MKTATFILSVAVLASLQPFAAADGLDDLIRTGQGFGPALPGFSKVICQVTTGSNCAEGAVITDDVTCDSSSTVPDCSATKCSGTGSDYHCDIHFYFRVRLSGIGIDPTNVSPDTSSPEALAQWAAARVPLFVNANGSADRSAAITEGVVWSGSQDPDGVTKRYDQIPVHGMDVQIPAVVCIALGPYPGTERVCEQWQTVAIHLPPGPAAGLDVEDFVGDPPGTALGIAANKVTEVSNFAATVVSWNPVPISVHPGPIPDPGSIPGPGDPGGGGVDGILDRVILKIMAYLP